MANEIRVTISATLTNSNLSRQFKPGTISVDQQALGAHAPVVIVNSSAEETLATGDISTLGFIALRNLSTNSTEFVTYGVTTSSTDSTMRPFGRLNAGEPALLRLEPGITFRWQANAGSPKVQVELWEN